MTLPTATQFARATLWGSFAFNASLLVLNVSRGKYETAALISVVLAVLAGWLAITPKLDRQLEARVDEAVNRRDMSYRVLQEMEKNLAVGTVQFFVDGHEGDARKH